MLHEHESTRHLAAQAQPSSGPVQCAPLSPRPPLSPRRAMERGLHRQTGGRGREGARRTGAHSDISSCTPPRACAGRQSRARIGSGSRGRWRKRGAVVGSGPAPSAVAPRWPRTRRRCSQAPSQGSKARPAKKGRGGACEHISQRKSNIWRGTPPPPAPPSQLRGWVMNRTRSVLIRDSLIISL